MNTKRNTSLYATIIPVWFMPIIPTMWLFVLPIKFLVITIVLWLCSKVFSDVEFKPLFRKTVLKVWLAGFTADIAGSFFLFLSQGNFGGWWYEYITTPVVLNPLDNPYSLCFALLGVAVSAFLIYLMNYRISLRDMDYSVETKRKIALALAVMTLPVLYIMPSRTIYDPDHPTYNFTNHLIWNVCTACDITPDTPVAIQADTMRYEDGFEAGYYVSEAINTAVKATSDVTRAPEYRLTFWNPAENADQRLSETELWFLDNNRVLFRINGQFYLADEYQSSEVMKVFTGEAQREIAQAAEEAESAALSDDPNMR